MSGIATGSNRERWFRVGRATGADAQGAGAEAAARAQRGETAALLIVFCSSRYDTAAVLDGICAVTPDEVPVVGGTTMGELAPVDPEVEGSVAEPSVVVTALGGPGFEVSTHVVRQASADRRGAGVTAAAAMGPISSPHRILFMIADGLTREQHELVRGVYSVVGMAIPVIGGCSADNLEYARTYQFHGTGAGVERLVDSIVAVGLGTTGPLGVGLAHGWTKFGEPMLVTSSDGGEVYTLDDEPALDVYLRRMGAERSVLDDEDKFRDLAFRYPLGMSRRNGEDIRVVHSGDAEGGSLLCLADVPQGALVWTMTTEPEALVTAAAQSTEMAVAGLGGAAPLGLVVFDCGARKVMLGPENFAAEHAAVTAGAAGAPFGGFYTFGEIARTSGSRGMHHLTVVTLALG